MVGTSPPLPSEVKFSKDGPVVTETDRISGETKLADKPSVVIPTPPPAPNVVETVMTPPEPTAEHEVHPLTKPMQDMISDENDAGKAALNRASSQQEQEIAAGKAALAGLARRINTSK